VLQARLNYSCRKDICLPAGDDTVLLLARSRLSWRQQNERWLVVVATIPCSLRKSEQTLLSDRERRGRMRATARCCCFICVLRVAESLPCGTQCVFRHRRPASTYIRRCVSFVRHARRNPSLPLEASCWYRYSCSPVVLQTPSSCLLSSYGLSPMNQVRKRVISSYEAASSSASLGSTC
jgi:hypothetical protein